MDQVPSKIDRYEILEEVGRGGMAVVYRGRDLSLDREVAVKVLHPHLSRDAENLARFGREAKAVARLHHPHIIEIYDFAETSEGPSYIVTEFVRGSTLREFMNEQQIFFPEIAVMIAAQICEAVAHAHGLKIVHRDLKPENVMVNSAGVLKLMDFGIAKVIDQQQQMTLTGTILGSPAHMAPELLEGKDLDFRSDIFSIGTILFWLATGQQPFSGKNPHQVIKRVVEGDFPDPQQVNPAIGSGLARIIRRTLENDPDKRYQSVSSLQTELLFLIGELDIDDAASELTFFFQSPEAYLEGLIPKVKQKLLESGKQAIKDGKTREALERLDRLLAIEPDHPEVIQLVDGIHRRARFKRRIALGAAGLAIILLASVSVWAALTYWPETNGDGGTDAGAIVMPVNAEEPDAGMPEDAGIAENSDNRAASRRDGKNQRDAGTAMASAADARARRAGDRKKPRRANGARVAVRKKTKHPVEIVVEPYFDRISIDGQQVAKNDKSTRYGHRFACQLEEGPHRVLIEHQACQDEEFEIKVPVKKQIRRKLNYLPALLVIESDSPQAGVYVDTNFKGTAAGSREAPITITMEGLQPKRQVHLRLVDPQGDEFSRKVTVRAGKRTVVKAGREDFSAADGSKR